MNSSVTGNPTDLWYTLQQFEGCAIIQLDAQGTILDWNTGAVNIYGYEAADVVGQSLAILFDHPNLATSILADMTPTTPRYHRMRHKTQFGQRLMIIASFLPIVGPYTDPEAASGTLMLVHNAHYEDRDTRSGPPHAVSDDLFLNVIIQRQTEELHRALQREQDFNQMQSQLMSMLAHDLRTPLSIIRTASDLLLQYHDRLTVDKREQRLVNIQQQVQLLDDMLTDLMMVYENRQVPHPNLADVDIVNYCQTLIDEIMQTRRCHIKFIYQVEQPTITIDDKALYHILTNLLSNAVKYSPSEEPILFLLEQQENQVVFRIQDKGIGIPKEDQAKVFDAFWRGSNVQQTAGTGLGLAIVKQAIGFLNGKIDFTSHLNKGTTFTVNIPC